MGDLISRQELIDEANKLENEHTRDVVKGLATMLPSVRPKNKTGKWEKHVFDGIMGHRPCTNMCSYCNYIYPHRTNYCPNCGARMEG